MNIYVINLILKRTAKSDISISQPYALKNLLTCGLFIFSLKHVKYVSIFTNILILINIYNKQNKSALVFLVLSPHQNIIDEHKAQRLSISLSV